MKQLTDRDSVVFSVIEYVGNDIVCAKLALDFIGDSQVKYQLFTKCYSLSSTGEEMSVTDKTNRAIAQASEMFALF